MGDDELLKHCANTGTSADWAFRELVDRYAGLVFSIAERRVGNRELAEEITQNVFTVLARKATQLQPRTSLAGWLHRATMLESTKALRTEMRRKRKLEAYQAMEETRVAHDRPNWDHVMPLLDEALHRLSPNDRDLILQHYFEERSYAEIAKETGRTKAACAKQGSRVMAKLCQLLRRKGVVISTAALGAGITSHFTKAAPAGFAQSLSSSALSAASTSAPFSLLTSFSAIMSATKFTTALALVIAGAALPISVQWANVQDSGITLSHNILRREHAPVTVTSSTEKEGGATHVEKTAGSIDLKLLEQELKKLPFPDESTLRELELQCLMFQLSEEDVPAVVAMIEQLDPKAVRRVATALFARWAEFDPQTAASKAEDLGDKWLVYAAREGLMITWAASDPAEALRYLENHPKGTDASSMVWATIGDMVDSDPSAALSLVEETLTDLDVRKNVTKTILEAWSESDPDAAMAWAGDHDEIQARSFSKAIISRLASHDPGRAFQLALDSEHTAIRIGSARWTLMQWSGRDARAASEAYVGMPKEFYHDEQMVRTSIHLAGEMTRLDPDQSLALAEQLPGGSPRDRWLYATAWGMASSQPERAAAIAETLPPDGYRKRSLERIAKEWLRQDPSAAGVWIEQSGHFNEAAKAQFNQ